MIPSSTKELIDIAGSKYGVVVATAKRARDLSEHTKNNVDYRLSSMVTIALDEIMKGRIRIHQPYTEKP
ncbi:MAG TPA: DNA-directed RNA polymerase subunit omega [Syntrophomonadaceae bacterium]|nr:DNA-directed RNA polymerase subunit omega [Syntrophomonadaceae bacterium]